LLARLGDEREAAVTRQELGRLARQQGRVEEAESLLMEALSDSRHIKDRQNVARTLRELGLLQLQQGQWEQALHTLLGAGVGLALINSPETSMVEEQLERLRAHIDEETILATVSRTTAEAPEQSYGLNQVAWSTAIHTFEQAILPIT
jgi:tetratricopeptide (TPR) repeat protein